MLKIEDLKDLTQEAADEVRHKGLFLERVKILFGKQATGGDFEAVCEALSAIGTDIYGQPCRVVLKVGSKVER